MIIIKTKFNNVLKFQNKVYKDKRGYFTEIFNKKISQLINIKFVQENLSYSKNIYTFRGLHYQKKPYEQGKLIRVLWGEIVDIILDINPRSNNFGKFVKIYLKKNQQLWIPPNYAHGFLTIKKNTLINYKVTKPYNFKSERGYSVFDDKLKFFSKKIVNKIIISEKDKKLKKLNEKK